MLHAAWWRRRLRQREREFGAFELQDADAAGASSDDKGCRERQFCPAVWETGAEGRQTVRGSREFFLRLLDVLIAGSSFDVWLCNVLFLILKLAS